MNWRPRWGQVETQASPEAQEETARTEDLLDKIAGAVVRRRLEVPAVLFLEMHRPLAFLGSQVLHFLTPVLGVAIRPEQTARLARLLDTPQGVERLIERIEFMAQQASRPPRRENEPTP
jgi:hypothetical protein